MMKFKRVDKNTKGVVAIEFALGFFAFFSMFLLWGEMVMVGFFSSVLDYSVSEASRDVRTISAEDYKVEFIKKIKSNDGIWTKFIDTSKFDISVKYYDDIVSVADEKNVGDDVALSSTLAVYKIDYNYTPMFTLFYDEGVIKLSRQVINLQEYERDEFSN